MNANAAIKKNWILLAIVAGVGIFFIPWTTGPDGRPRSLASALVNDVAIALNLGLTVVKLILALGIGALVFFLTGPLGLALYIRVLFAIGAFAFGDYQMTQEQNNNSAAYSTNFSDSSGGDSSSP